MASIDRAELWQIVAAADDWLRSLRQEDIAQAISDGLKRTALLTEARWHLAGCRLVRACWEYATGAETANVAPLVTLTGRKDRQLSGDAQTDVLVATYAANQSQQLERFINHLEGLEG